MVIADSIADSIVQSASEKVSLGDRSRVFRSWSAQG